MYVSDDTHWVFLNTHHPHFLWFQDRGTAAKEKRRKVSTYASSSIWDEDRRVRCLLDEDKEVAFANDMTYV